MLSILKWRSINQTCYFREGWGTVACVNWWRHCGREGTGLCPEGWAWFLRAKEWGQIASTGLSVCPLHSILNYLNLRSTSSGSIIAMEPTGFIVPNLTQPWTNGTCHIQDRYPWGAKKKDSRKFTVKKLPTQWKMDVSLAKPISMGKKISFVS